MQVLPLEQAGLLTWSKSKKNKCLFATASIYDSFATNSSSLETQQDGLLQIYSFDIINKTSSSQKLGSTTFQGGNFTSLDWESFGETDNFPYGIIATGFDNGGVGLWDPSLILQNNQENSAVLNQKGLISLQEVHEAPVNTIAFNPFKQYLIASGGVEVAVHNIEKNIAEPDVFSPGNDVHQGSPITSVSWNRKVPHILGSASQNGTSVVWDLKINKAVFNFSDHNRVQVNRNVCLSWNPEIPTQIAVVYDDAKVPELQIWDLRNPKGPIFCTTKGHTKGIHSLDWSITDPSLIITLGRDNKICTWNYKLASENLISEFTLDEPCSQVKWSPKQPEIFSVTSNSNSSTIYSLNNQLDHIPAWIRPRVGARFSFGGRLAVFSEKAEMKVHEYQINVVNNKLEPYLKEFEKNLDTSKPNFERLCKTKIESKMLNENEKEQWTLIEAVGKNEPDEIIEALGFKKNEIMKKAEEYTGKNYVTRKTEKTVHKVGESNFIAFDAIQAEEFFNRLAEDVPAKKKIINERDNDEDVTQETIIKNTNWNASVEKIIKTNILVGNIEGAIDSALKCGRVAEALLLAYSKGEEFFKSTMKSYVTSCNDPFVKSVIKYLVEDEIEELVLNYSLEEWKECVALCANLSQKNSHTFKKYMELLANRFIQEKDSHENALLCNILAKNFQNVLETLKANAEKYTKGSSEHSIFLMNAIEKIIAMKMVTSYQASNALVDGFIYELSKVLQAHNRDVLILNLISLNNSTGFDCLLLKDRIQNSSLELLGLFPSKGYPFHKETVNIKLNKKATANGIKGSQVHRPASLITQTNQLGSRTVAPNQQSSKIISQPIQREEIAPPSLGSEKVQSHPPIKSEIREPNNFYQPAIPKLDSVPHKVSPFPQNTTNLTSAETKSNSNFPQTQTKSSNLPKPVDLSRPGPPVINVAKQMKPPKTTTDPIKTEEITPPNFGLTNQPKFDSNLLQPPFKGPNFPKPAGPNRPGVPLPSNSTGPIAGPMGGHTKVPLTGPTDGSVSGLVEGTILGTLAGPKVVDKPGYPTNTLVGGPPSGSKGVPKASLPLAKQVPGLSGGILPNNSIPKVGPPNLMNQGPKFPIKSASTITSLGSANIPQGIDGSNLPSNYQPIYEAVMTGLEMLEEIDDNNSKKKIEMEQKMQTLFDILAAGTMKQTSLNALIKLCQDLDNDNYASALQLLQKIRREDYVDNKDWLYVMGRIVERR